LDLQSSCNCEKAYGGGYNKGRGINPKLCKLKEKILDIEREVQALKSNLLDRWNFLQKAQDKLGFLQQNLHSFQKKVQNKEIEA
jgi:uncharacterized coiled-coil protein SlyX